MSLNDVCVYVPVWFGVAATVFLGLLTSECTGSYSAGIVGASIMIIIPAHIMRSVGGGYDNESVAMTAMMMTFYCWTRSLREDKSVKNGEATWDSYVYGTLCGLSYIYGCYVGRVHLRLEPNCSTRCCFGFARPLFQQIAPRVLSVLYYWDNWSDSCPGCWVGTVKIYGTVVGPCCVCAYQILEY